MKYRKTFYMVKLEFDLRHLRIRRFVLGLIEFELTYMYKVILKTSVICKFVISIQLLVLTSYLSYNMV